MAGTTSTTASSKALLSPPQVESLLITPVTSLSVAALVSTLVRTDGTTHRLPYVRTDPSAAWTLEGAEIAPSNLDVDEVVVTPSKLAGLSIVSSELADDSSPAAIEAVGLGLARDCARQLDAAFFGNVAAPGPKGLGGLAGVSIVDAGLAFENLDAFAEALSLAEQVGAVVGSFVAAPATVLALSKLKKATGSNVALLGSDTESPTGRDIAGVPVYSSQAVEAGVVWSIPRDRSTLVLRKAATVESDKSVFFSSDRVAIRAILRAGFGFAHPAAIVKIAVTP